MSSFQKYGSLPLNGCIAQRLRIVSLKKTVTVNAVSTCVFTYIKIERVPHSLT